MTDPNPIVGAIRKFYQDYHDGKAPEDSVLESMATRYAGREKDLWKMLYTEYESIPPGDDVLDGIVLKYPNTVKKKDATSGSSGSATIVGKTSSPETKSSQDLEQRELDAYMGGVMRQLPFIHEQDLFRVEMSSYRTAIDDNYKKQLSTAAARLEEGKIKPTDYDDIAKNAEARRAKELGLVDLQEQEGFQPDRVHEGWEALRETYRPFFPTERFRTAEKAIPKLKGPELVNDFLGYADELVAKKMGLPLVGLGTQEARTIMQQAYAGASENIPGRSYGDLLKVRQQVLEENAEEISKKFPGLPKQALKSYINGNPGVDRVDFSDPKNPYSYLKYGIVDNFLDANYSDLDKDKRLMLRKDLLDELTNRPIAEKAKAAAEEEIKAKGIPVPEVLAKEFDVEAGKLVESFTEGVKNFRNRLEVTAQTGQMEYEKTSKELQAAIEAQITTRQKTLQAQVNDGMVSFEKANEELLALQNEGKAQLKNLFDTHSQNLSRQQREIIQEAERFQSSSMSALEEVKEKYSKEENDAAAAYIETYGRLYDENIQKIQQEASLARQEEYNKLSVGERIGNAVHLGYVDMFDSFGGGLKWLGMYEAGNFLTDIAEQENLEIPLDDLGQFDSKDLGKASWWIDKGIRMLPTTLHLMATGVGTTGAVSGALAKAGMTQAARTAIGAAAGAAAMRPIEALMEAGQYFNTAMQDGKSVEEASEGASNVFAGDMALYITDILQLSMAFGKLPIKIKPGVYGKIQKAGGMLGHGAMNYVIEGGEEVYQGYLQEKQDNPLLTFMEYAQSPQGLEAGVLGGISGVALSVLSPGGSGQSTAVHDLLTKYADEKTTDQKFTRDNVQKRYFQVVDALNALRQKGVLNEGEFLDAMDTAQTVHKTIMAGFQNQLPMDYNSQSHREYTALAVELGKVRKRSEAEKDPTMKAVYGQAMNAMETRMRELLTNPSSKIYSVDGVPVTEADFLSLLSNAQVREFTPATKFRVENDLPTLALAAKAFDDPGLARMVAEEFIASTEEVNSIEEGIAYLDKKVEDAANGRNAKDTVDKYTAIRDVLIKLQDENVQPSLLDSIHSGKFDEALAEMNPDEALAAYEQALNELEKTAFPSFVEAFRKDHAALDEQIDRTPQEEFLDGIKEVSKAEKEISRLDDDFESAVNDIKALERAKAKDPEVFQQVDDLLTADKKVPVEVKVRFVSAAADPIMDEFEAILDDPSAIEAIRAEDPQLISRMEEELKTGKVSPEVAKEIVEYEISQTSDLQETFEYDDPDLDEQVDEVDDEYEGLSEEDIADLEDMKAGRGKYDPELGMNEDGEVADPYHPEELDPTEAEIIDSNIDRLKEELKDVLSRMRNVGFAFDPKIQAEENLQFYGKLSQLAYWYVRAGINSVEEFAAELGLKVTEALNTAWEKAWIPAGNRIFNNPLPEARQIAQDYMAEKGLTATPFDGITTLDQERAKKIADEYQRMKHDPENPAVKEAFEALAAETLDQYKAIRRWGYTPILVGYEPYASSEEMIEDLRRGKRMLVLATGDVFGNDGDAISQDNPMLRDSGFIDAAGKPMLVNDVFRFVHDFFGHAKLGNGFGPLGEENAWNVHARMYSPLAARAMTTETRGQNSFVNFSGVNDKAFALRDEARRMRREGKVEEAKKKGDEAKAAMVFAEQKTGLLPEWVSTPTEQGTSIDENISRLKSEIKERFRAKFNLGLTSFPEDSLLDDIKTYGKMVELAYNYIRKGVKTIQDLAAALGVAVDDNLKNVWAAALELHKNRYDSVITMEANLSTFDGIREFLQDRDIAIKNLQAELLQLGVDIDDASDLYKQRELLISKVDHAVRAFHERMIGMAPHLPNAAAVNAASWVGRAKAAFAGNENILDDISLYMYAKHATDFNARVFEMKTKEREEKLRSLEEKRDNASTMAAAQRYQNDIDKILTDNAFIPITNGSGMRDDQARAIVDWYENMPDFAEFDAFVQEFRKEVIEARINLLETHGMLTPERIQALKDGTKEGFDSVFHNYVPLKVTDAAYFADFDPGKGGLSRGGTLKSVKGTSRFTILDRHNPLSTALADYAGTIKQVERNQTSRALYNLIKAQPDKSFWDVVPSRAIVTLDDSGKPVSIQDMVSPEIKANSITVTIDGKLSYLYFKPMLSAKGPSKGQVVTNPVLRAIQSNPLEQNDQMNAVLAAARLFIAFRRNVITTYNIAFGIPNFARDLQESLGNIETIKQDLNLKHVRARFMANLLPAMAAIAKSPWDTSGTMGGIWAEAQAAGMKMSWAKFDQSDKEIEKYEKEIEKYHKNKGVKGLPLHSAKVILDRVSMLNDIMENTTRLALYAALRQNGISPQRAASAAKNITLNFEKKGRAGNVINALWLFANAGIQGAARGAQLVVHRPNGKYVLNKRGLAIGAGLAAFAFMNKLLFDLWDDEDKDKFLSEFDRENNLYIFNPVAPSKPLKVPKPYSFLRIFMNLGENAYSAASGETPVGRAILGETISSIEAFANPITGSQPNKISAVVPEFLSLYTEWKMNKKWNNTPFHYKEDYEPGSEKYTKQTPAWLVGITDKVNDFTDINGKGEGVVSISPALIQYIGQQFFGGVGAETIRTAGLVDNLIHEEGIKLNETTIVRRFIHDLDDNERAAVGKLYELTKRGRMYGITDHEIQVARDAYQLIKQNDWMPPQTLSRIRSEFKKRWGESLK